MKIINNVFIVAMLVGTCLIPSTYAQEDLGSWMDGLLQESSFGYKPTQKIEVDSIDTTKIVIKSPMIIGELDENITNYTAMYSEYSIADVLEDTELLKKTTEKNINIGTNDGNSDFNVELLSDADKIDVNKLYFISFVPKDEFGVPGDLSNEICFKLSTKFYGEGDACVSEVTTTTTDTTHAAAAVDMNQANVSHSINGNKVTLTWRKQDGASQVDIFNWNPTDEKFEKLATVNMSDEIYTFNTNRNGEHNIKFLPLPSGTEKVYSFSVTAIVNPGPNPGPTPNPTPNPGVTKVPVVGPKENMIVILFVAFIGYYIYRKVYRH